MMSAQLLGLACGHAPATGKTESAAPAAAAVAPAAAAVAPETTPPGRNAESPKSFSAVLRGLSLRAVADTAELRGDASGAVDDVALAAAPAAAPSASGDGDAPAVDKPAKAPAREADDLPGMAMPLLPATLDLSLNAALQVAIAARTASVDDLQRPVTAGRPPAAVSSAGPAPAPVSAPAAGAAASANAGTNPAAIASANAGANASATAGGIIGGVAGGVASAVGAAIQPWPGGTADGDAVAKRPQAAGRAAASVPVDAALQPADGAAASGGRAAIAVHRFAAADGAGGDASDGRPGDVPPANPPAAASGERGTTTRSETAPTATASALPDSAPLPGQRPEMADTTLKLAAGAPTQWRQALSDALGERLQVQVSRNVEQAVIRLDPPNLGRIDIAISHDAGNLQVHLSASNADVLRQLHDVGTSLRQDLAQRQTGEVLVTVSDANARGGDPRQRGRQADADDDPGPGRALADAEIGHAPTAYRRYRERE